MFESLFIKIKVGLIFTSAYMSADIAFIIIIEPTTIMHKNDFYA